MKVNSSFLIIIFTSLLLLFLHGATSLGSSSTIAITYATSTVCGIIAAHPTQTIQCYQNGQAFSIQPNISFEAISGGHTFFCGLRSGGFTVFCWDTTTTTFESRRIYNSNSIQLTDLTVGDYQVCAREVNSGVAKCWRGKGTGTSTSPFPLPSAAFKFATITSGSGFTCGILRNNSRVYCWGNNDVGTEIQSQFANLTMSNLVAGKSHACGLTRSGFLVCKGRNESGQLDVPFSSAFEFSGLALGSDFSCAIKQRNGLATCWGGGATKFQLNSNSSKSQIELMVSGLNFTCGLTTRNLSIMCWGLGWSNGNGNDIGINIPLGTIIPGPCVQSPCSTCGTYPDSEILCDGSGSICKSCQIELPIAVPLPPKMAPPSQQLSNSSSNKYTLAFVVFGSVGIFAGICAIIYCLHGLIYRRKNKNIVQPSASANAVAVTNYSSNITAPTLKSYSARRYGSQRMELGSSRGLGRQRSESSSNYMEKTLNFSLSELLVATNNFSSQNKIGAGSFGSVYKGKLLDGRQVAIKRGESLKKKFQEKESAFESELALLSRLHHKHLVDLIGFCEEMDEMLLVYEFMSNGALHDHLHRKNNVSNILNSWRMRIKIALDAARGIEYLHNYAVPPIIHRDIKSSNILIDANWTAKVSDFGLSLMGPESDRDFMSTKAVGTVGYIDPEYYVLNVLTSKSDVYGLGVVLLELLTGKKAVFKTEEEGRGPVGVVEYAAPVIREGKLKMVLDKRVGPPEMHQTEAVELMAYTASHCVNLEGKERPNIVDIVATLERAFALCEESPARVSFTSCSIPSD